ncbi:MAG: ATP-binding protein, partial [Prevotellaceae bacterium]|nr:ATP-binding protein [Prevotellaceae bacterium]
SDCGKGIPKDKSEWVFEQFTKVDEFVQGTGLGLAICREVMKRLHGSIHVDTDYTCGCRMVFTLPNDGTASS